MKARARNLVVLATVLAATVGLTTPSCQTATQIVVAIETDRGHDAFLLDEPELFAAIDGFLRSAARARGLDEGR